MVAQFTAEEIVELTGARLAQGMMPDDELGGISSDTRTLQEGDWYLALSGGEHFDGHEFLGDAFAAGALGCIVEERGHYPIASTQFPLLAVDNTYEAFQQLARNWRRRLNPRVVAVSGSPHERSLVVDVCTTLLQEQFNLVTHDEGTVESLLSCEVGLPEGVQLLIAKVCPRELAQAELLGRALCPTIVVLTEQGFEHLRAANENAIARAECDLLAHLEKVRGVGIVTKRSRDLLTRIKYHFPERVLLMDEGAVNVARSDSSGTFFEFAGSSELFRFGIECSAEDAWSIVAVCRQLGLSDADIAHRLSGV